MNNISNFSIEFDYPLSADLIIKLSAEVQLHREQGCYSVFNFHTQAHPAGKLSLPNIIIMAVKEAEAVYWIHTDSYEETLLSLNAGKAIEAAGYL